MKLIDYLRRNSMCLDHETGESRFDASELIHSATVFDISEIAAQIIQSTTEMESGATEIRFTERGKEWVKLCHDEGGYSLDHSQYVGIIPPFERCWFEYPTRILSRSGSSNGIAAVHLRSMPKEWIAREFPDQGFVFVMVVTVFFSCITARTFQRVTGVETHAMIASGPGGQLLRTAFQARLPPGENRMLEKNRPQVTPVVIVLIAVMMLNCRLVKSTHSPEIVKSRQQRRHDERHPQSVQVPFVRYYTLSLDTNTVSDDGTGMGRGGWEQAWHKVRGFLRRMKSGKIVPVRPHSRGNPLKGVILKDYELKAPKSKGA